MTEQEKCTRLLNYLENKTAAVVGSGASLLGSRLGKAIESYDVIVRINRGYPYESYRADVGSRTDIWSFGMGADWENKKKMHKLFSDRKFSMYHWWDHRWVPDYIRNLDNHVTLPNVISRKAASACGGKPVTTGAEAINFLLGYTKISELGVFGVDFYKTGYWFMEEDGSVEPTVVSKTEGTVHNVIHEELFLNKLVQTSSCKVNWNKSN